MSVQDTPTNPAPLWSNPKCEDFTVLSWSREISIEVEGDELTIELSWSDWDRYEVELLETTGDEEFASDFVDSLRQSDLHELDMATCTDH